MYHPLAASSGCGGQSIFYRKSNSEGRTETHVRKLSEEERVAEIARMLSGAEITDLTIEHARELLALAHR